MPPNQHQLGAVLRRERQRAHMTVRKRAETADLAPSSVSRIESGSIESPAPDLLQRLARALGIDAEELYASAQLAAIRARKVGEPKKSLLREFWSDVF